MLIYWDSRGTFGPRRKYSTGSFLLTSSPSMTLTHPPFSIALPLTSPLLPSLLLFPAPGRCYRTWVRTIHQFFYLSRFRPNERPPSFNFQKARWDGFDSYFDSHCPSAKEYSSLSSAAALFTSLTLNAAKSSIPFGRIKRPPKAWWSAEVEEAVSERRRAFAAAHRSDEDRQAYISASRQSSPRPRLRHGRRLALLFHLGLTLNLYTLLRSIAGSPSSSPSSSNCSSPRESASVYAAYLRSHFSISQPKATSLSSAEPRARRSLTLPFALLSHLLNFLRLPPTSPRSPPLVQTKLPIPC